LKNIKKGSKERIVLCWVKIWWSSCKSLPQKIYYLTMSKNGKLQISFAFLLTTFSRKTFCNIFTSFEFCVFWYLDGSFFKYLVGLLLAFFQLWSQPSPERKVWENVFFCKSDLDLNLASINGSPFSNFCLYGPESGASTKRSFWNASPPYITILWVFSCIIKFCGSLSWCSK
jgi:hypothetical protein